MAIQAEKCEAFAELHRGETFMIPNPWDAGTARLMQGMGFKALATSSSAFALTIAKGDGEPTLEEKLAHCASITAATDIPLNVDFEDGFADAPADVATNVSRLIETGAAGCSIEDFSRGGQSLFDFDHAVERVAAAAEVTSKLDFPFMLTARAENLLRGVNDLDDTIRRLQAYQEAGADVLYSPGIRSLEDLATVTAAIDRPFNVLGVMLPQAKLADFAAAGAQRVSIGGALTYATMKPFLEFGEAMVKDGDMSWVAQMASGGELARLLKA